MPGLSKALIQRLHKAAGQDRCSDAVLFMSQLFCVQGKNVDSRDQMFIREITNLAQEHQCRGDLQSAEEHYFLALALYEKCFSTHHLEVLPTIRGLADVLRQQEKHKELIDVLDRGVPVINRLVATLQV